MEAVLKLSFSEEKGINCCACMLSFSKGERYHCAAIGQRPICPEKKAAEEIVLWLKRNNIYA